MMINPMMYRVFLRDEKDTPDLCENPDSAFRIQSGEILAWQHSDPSWRPSLDEQLQHMHCGGSRIGPLPEKIDGFSVICMDGYPVGVVQNEENLAQRSYDLAVQYARELAADMTRDTGKHYEFIDVTSRGDRKRAEGLAAIVVHEDVGDPSPRAADVGD